MPETDKQEGQKTVVAFIAGLLIGGLLVWVFSSSPENAPLGEQNGDDTEDIADDTENTNNTNDSSQTSSVSNATNNNSDRPTEDGEGVLDVDDQAAGSVVELASVAFPTTEGWVVVRDLIDGEPGRILGAARYHQEVGLVPESVNLLRATEAGKTYQVTFYSESGDRVFNVSNDIEMNDAASASFRAQ